MSSRDDAILEEVSQIRAEWVSGYVTRRIDHRDGDATNEQISQWEKDAYRIWREKHPALSEFLIAHRDSKAGA